MNQGMYSSNSGDWATPDPVYKMIEEKYGPFNLDPAASKWNAKTEKYYTQQDNGLDKPWTGRVFCNPPYGREIAKWVSKADIEVAYGDCIRAVLLLPARTDTAWFHKYIYKIREVELLQGRIQFTMEDGKTGRAPFPSMIVVFDKGD